MFSLSTRTVYHYVLRFSPFLSVLPEAGHHKATIILDAVILNNRFLCCIQSRLPSVPANTFLYFLYSFCHFLRFYGCSWSVECGAGCRFWLPVDLKLFGPICFILIGAHLVSPGEIDHVTLSPWEYFAIPTSHFLWKLLPAAPGSKPLTRKNIRCCKPFPDNLLRLPSLINSCVEEETQKKWRICVYFKHLFENRGRLMLHHWFNFVLAACTHDSSPFQAYPLGPRPVLPLGSLGFSYYCYFCTEGAREQKWSILHGLLQRYQILVIQWRSISIVSQLFPQ